MAFPLIIPIVSAILPAIGNLLAQATVKRVLPKVILEAEQLEIDGVPATGVQKKEWVEAFFTDLWDIFQSRGIFSEKYRNTAIKIFSWLSPEIERQLAKLKAKGRIA